MKNKALIFILLWSIAPLIIKAQKSTEFLPDKPGKWTYSTNIKRPGAEVVAFNKNLASVAEWFHQNVPMLTNPRGFDLLATSFDISNNNYKRNACNYALRSEMNFDFQLFLSDLARGGKWTVEPPGYGFYINDTESGHGTNPNWNYFSEQDNEPGETNYNLSQQKEINAAVTKMNGVFAVFPFVKEFAPGAKLFGDGNLIVFNPERPDFWLPVTVREMAEMYLEYYTQLNDEYMLPYIKKEMEGISEDEMNAPAFSGSDVRDFLRFNGKGEGLQFMRFNPDYWNKLLPPSAIQFMTFYYPQLDETALAESCKNNGHPKYSQLLVNEIDWGKLAAAIINPKH